MSTFLCGACKLECQNCTIRCSECNKWYHTKCINMPDEELKSWSVRSVSFYCRACAFDGDEYDADLALTRMKLADSDLTRLVIGTDDEIGMVKAITTAFPDSTHVLCTRHLRENATQKLKDDAVDKNDRKAIVDKIFGQGGILDADDTICFEEKCADLETFSCKVSSKFTDHFNKRLKNQLLTKVNGPARQDKIDNDCTNNNCESINHVLNKLVVWKSKPLTEFVALVNDFVDGQFKELRSALLGTGEYRLADSHGQFHVSKTDWVTKTQEQRQRHFKKFRTFTVTDSKIMTSTDGQSDIVAPRTHGKKPGQKRRKINERTLTNKKTKTTKK